jgi:hypothetical protein
MTYDSFLSKVETLLGKEIPKPLVPAPRYNDRAGILYANIFLFENEPVLVNAWHVGGKRGGSCWGGVPESYTTGDPEPEWTVLDTILEHFCPNITYLKYKKLMSLVNSDSSEDGDYYGNTSIYTIRILKFEDLYNFLKGFLPETD